LAAYFRDAGIELFTIEGLMDSAQGAFESLVFFQSCTRNRISLRVNPLTRCPCSTLAAQMRNWVPRLEFAMEKNIFAH
jgi:hypothetical protein